jgi:hypothetical protein
MDAGNGFFREGSRRKAGRFRDAFRVLFVVLAAAQGQASAEVKPIGLSGSFNAMGGLYAATGTSNRQDPAQYRLALNPTVSIFDQVSLPFELYLSSSGNGYRQPFDQFGVSPHIGNWLTLHGGYFSTQLTDLSFGDTRLLGGGIDLHPSLFRLVLLYGRSQKARQADTVVGLHGLYDRWVAGGLIGAGRQDGTHFALAVLRVADDTASLHDPRAVAAADTNLAKYYNGPKENLVASLSWAVSILKNFLTWRGEVAGSAFTNDATDSVVRSPSIPSWIDPVFTPRSSSQMDAAAKTSVVWAPAKMFQLGLNGRWVGPGYVTLGYNGMASDVFDFTVAPSFRFDNGKYVLKPSFGMRYNNLRDTRIATTQRIIYAFTGVVQPVTAFGGDVQYTNYGTSSNARNDTLRVSNVSQSFTMTPHYTFSAWKAVQIVTATYAFQDFTDQNVVTANLDKFTVNSASALWNLSWPSTLTLAANLNAVSTVASQVTTTIAGATVTGGRSFFDKNALSVNANVGFNWIQAGKADWQLTAGVSASYKIPRWGAVSILVSSNHYDYGAAGSVPSFQEYQGTLQYTLSF